MAVVEMEEAPPLVNRDGFINNDGHALGNVDGLAAGVVLCKQDDSTLDDAECLVLGVSVGLLLGLF